MSRFLLFLWFWSLSLQCLELEVVTEEAPPLQYIIDGELKGRSTDIVKEVLNTAGIVGNFNVYPWARSFQIAKNNKNTLIYSILRYQEREHQFAWIGAIGRFRLGFVHLNERVEIKISSFDDVKKWRLGIVRGDFTHHYLQNIGFKEDHHFIVRGTLRELMDLLYSRKIDVFISDLPLIVQFAQAYGYDDSVLAGQFYPEDFDRKVYLAANISTDPAVIRALKLALEQVRAMPEFKNGFKRSLPEMDRKRLLRKSHIH